MNKVRKYYCGQTIIEAVVAVTVISTIIIAVVSAVTLSISTSTIAKNKSLANQFVQEGIEAVRTIRDVNWDSIYAEADGEEKYITRDNATGVWTFTGAVVTPAPGFSRVIVITPNSPEELDVFVTVNWQQGAKMLTSKNTARLTKWQ